MILAALGAEGLRARQIAGTLMKNGDRPYFPARYAKQRKMGSVPLVSGDFRKQSQLVRRFGHFAFAFELSK